MPATMNNLELLWLKLQNRMFIVAKAHLHDAFILFDPGSTHNFVSIELATKLGIQEFEMGDTMKVDGAFIGQDVLVTPLIGKLRLHIQGYEDKEEIFISPLKHEDVIPGAPWFDCMATSIKFPERKRSFKVRKKYMYINAQELGSTIPPVNGQAFDKSITSSIFVYITFFKDSLNGVNETQANESGLHEYLELSNFLNQFQDIFIDNNSRELSPKRGDDDHMIELLPGTLENGLFVLDRYEKQIQACIAETKTQAMQDAELWHARFGHVGYGSLMTLQRHNMVHDLSLLEMPPRHLVHSDVCGPMRTPSVGNSLYFVTFIDDFSRFCWVYPLKAKSDVFAVFQHYVSMVENETGCKVQTLRTDRGGEYMSGAFKDFLGKKGIKHQCTMPYTPQQNGVAERKNRSLMEMARCMLKAKSLPHKLWMEAVACAAHVLNRCPTRALKTITPYESWYDRKPSVSYLRVFGCLAYAHIPQQLRGKLDDKAVKCIFVGYSSGSKGYRLYNPATNKIFESRDVIFAETTAQPMVAFDVPHMQTQDVFEGFLPSFVENQESQQVDNFDQSFDKHVTPHDVEEIVREEQEVLREERTLPKWSVGSQGDARVKRAGHKERRQKRRGAERPSAGGADAQRNQLA
ncbi:hypothetical protein L7F22_005223 [Adiantum nelumboides]|nr:hypothetical protein [Adiantum nelumboides]